MRLSDNGLNLIKQFEGLRLKAYQCSAGVWTIGYGHTKGVKSGQTITTAEVDELLRQDVAGFECGVCKLLTRSVTQNQFDALVSFAFNVGLQALKTSTLLRRLNANEPAEKVAAEFLRWNKAGGKVLPGLTRRRQAEADLFLTSGTND